MEKTTVVKKKNTYRSRKKYKTSHFMHTSRRCITTSE